MMGEEHFACYGRLIDAVRTGETVFDKIYGMGVFDFLSQHPEQGRTFDEAMVGVHGRETAAMLSAYDFAGIGTLADVGGGNGSLLVANWANTHNCGACWSICRMWSPGHGPTWPPPDWPSDARWRRGNFFESVPGGADAYLMRHIIHDWDDERSTLILQQHPPGARRPRQAAAGRRGNPAGQRALVHQAAGPDHAGHSRRQGTDRSRIPRPAGRGRFPIGPDRAHASEVSVIEAVPV